MFASRHRTINRRIAGLASIVAGAACLVLSVYPTAAVAAPAPKLDDLTLTALCTIPGGNAVFRVGNTNSDNVPYTWDIDKTSFSGSGDAKPGNSYLYVPPSADNLRVYVDGKQQLAPKQDGDLCAFHVHPVKRWVDATGDDLESPDVPKLWKLTLDSDIESLSCVWKKDTLSCKSKADVEAHGDFAVEKPYLDVPFGSSFTITESATPGFIQTGTGPSDNLSAPTNLEAFFGGADELFVTVTNQEEAIAAATTTVAPTTTASPPTTIGTPDEPTTTTTTTGEETTTTTGEETTTTTGEETTTTVEAVVDGEGATTLAPTTTASPTTTVAPPTTAPPTTLSSDSTAPADNGTIEQTTTTTGETTTSIGAPRTPELGNEVDPAAVEASGDSLPVTGGEAAFVAGLGCALIVAGLAVLALAWGSATPGRHARRRRVAL